ncbi:hypothetical protein MINTM008_01570 [Mycobacterium intracellulare]|nr:hypothetical protein MINTM006_01550 [Mycobacterium intracellulare]BCO70822.1 hypothetical protein MINTM008_01570 [Mycobacterium intracellulare]BCO76374.1 hypothetical protein MINTM009_01560 [Mycobacterium intracellulare]BCP18367.1 hypothetical protein MINTM023_01560 [Mycobacterium intracellulare]BCP23804.1 hypothetical protein MINTM025_01600 [Mycobacterium intracellulare]
MAKEGRVSDNDRDNEAGLESRRRKLAHRAAATVAATMAVSLLSTPPAGAEPITGLQQAVTAARGSTHCSPLRYDPVVERAAQIVNKSTDDYVSNRAKNVPADGVTDALPILKDLGSGATKAWSLQGAGHSSDADAIKSVLLEGNTPGAGKDLRVSSGNFKPLEQAGPAAFANCAYTDYGASLLHNDMGFSLAVVVLAGK